MYATLLAIARMVKAAMCAPPRRLPDIGGRSPPWSARSEAAAFRSVAEPTIDREQAVQILYCLDHYLAGRTGKPL